ncbi:C4-dicarboxylate transport protein [Jeotgalicoccus aerolatus]|uniref:Na+/H+-dicarboxylate symporter n=1 Tax=Jeotgalicoccus aerolatus TaxID=709510 RepID=A0ABS4HMJ6_9STAP|nr:dicarboxylate/amino acid:cation symporter [Jeotgalicoccus aerolatus]MBP1952110.1 Na+/H+-dicarboxylate symporter [Jeotgalicoccus aerolatus]NMA81580.1 dicarboxylate/amino acid:cation symporter [Jeotgalicoccus aerolatus]CAD2070967.1 C4-dicarboxylate transport protein [Jeotgalicoccus aerolatus]GGE05977.1 proton/glutamate symporter [Jeotgalicoccus aerolatus]HJG32100.1 dicarboxylate/amino acid:cation symporter [Jeotgalicoccus aerolatus]
MKYWFKLPLYTQIAIGAIIGVILGFILGENAKYIAPIGDAFLQFLKMLIIPLVITTILSGILKMNDIKSFGKVGGGFLFYLLITSLLATAIGFIVALIIQPGKGNTSFLDHGEAVETEEFSFLDHFLNMIPANIFESLTNMDMLPIIIFTIIVGLIILSIGKEKSGTVIKFIEESANIMIKMTEFVIQLAPYGILALMTNLVGTFGSNMLSAVASFILADYLAMALVFLLVYPLILKFIAKVNPFQFYKNIYPSILFAFTTSTSSATIPVSLRVMKRNVGVSEKTSGFTVPFGATANMDGMAVALGVISVFATNLYNIELTIGLFLQIIFLGLILSLGAAGVRGAGIIFSMILLETLGLPLELVPVLAAVWPIIDMGHTTVNVTGDLTGTTVVARKTGDFDETVFYQKNNNIDINK